MPWSRREVLRGSATGMTALSSRSILGDTNHVESAARGDTNHVGSTGDVATGQTTYPIADRLGANHVDSSYVFTDHNNLNEGAKRLQELGSNVIKIWFHFLDEKYPYNSDWPEFDDVVDIASHRYLQELFERPFSTYVLVAYSFVEGDYNHYFRDGVSDQQYAQEANTFYRLTKYLLEEYRNTEKEFIFQHWQGDWAILDPEEVESIAAHDIQSDDPEPDQVAIDGMIRWLNARQEGIERARREVDSDAKVFGACEVNLVLRAMRGQKRIIDAVVPETNVDLVSHNIYRSMFRGFVPPNPNNPDVDALTPPKHRNLIRASLDYVQERAPEPSAYVTESLVDPTKNVFVGEYGFPATKHPGEKARISRLATDVALEWGARWLLYWQLYDDPKHGHWLIRDDNTTTPTYEYMNRLIEANREPPLPSYTRVEIQYDRADANRSFRCFEITLRGSDESVIDHYDIGNLLQEPHIYDGSFWVETVKGEPCRWFGGPESRTVLFFRSSTLRDVATFEFDGRANVAETTATLVVDGRNVSSTTLSTDRDRYELPLSRSIATEATETDSRTTTPHETDSKVTERQDSLTETASSGASGASTPTSTSISTTADDADGFGFLPTLGVLGTGAYLVRRRSEE